jgi:hypothetical protein
LACFDLGLVMLENEDVIFDATPRAPLAAVAIAAIAASWIEVPSQELGTAAIRDGTGCVSAGAGDGAGTSVAGRSLPCWEPFWLGNAG